MGNNKTQKRKVQITSIITLFVFLVDIYLIIYVPADYILATAAFITLVSTIFTINSWFKLKDIEDQRREEQYTDIMKAEKGTYVITQEMLKELDNKINFIGQKIMPLGKAGDENQRKIASMLDGIVQDQKKIAKITISRSKENADALMNSNDQLLVQMTEFRNAIEVIREQVNKQAEIGEHEGEDFGEIKNELFEKMQELSNSIKKEVDEISENIEMSNHSVESLVSASNKKTQEEVAQAQEAMPTEEAIVTETAQEEMPTEEAVVTETAQEAMPTEEAVVTETAQETMPTEEAVVTETAQEAMPTEEAVFPETVQMNESSASEVIPAEEPVIPETIQIEGNDEIISELLKEQKSLEEAVFSQEAQAEEPATEQAIADPNKPMSPEDIAALIANTATEDLPEETIKFEEEEKPPMPDMSDPNKPMSPDDIAALIANM
ncbi:MAG: hypothetical protein HFH37_10900 [Lachnospiraceae bacterium]|nr:hypothetical protein [Lachnospiraceae bacterium]